MVFCRMNTPRPPGMDTISELDDLPVGSAAEVGYGIVSRKGAHRNARVRHMKGSTTSTGKAQVVAKGAANGKLPAEATSSEYAMKLGRLLEEAGKMFREDIVSAGVAEYGGHEDERIRSLAEELQRRQHQAAVRVVESIEEMILVEGVMQEVQQFNRVVRNSERDLLRLSADRFMEQYPALMRLSDELEDAQAAREGDCKEGRALKPKERPEWGVKGEEWEGSESSSHANTTPERQEKPRRHRRARTSRGSVQSARSPSPRRPPRPASLPSPYHSPHLRDPSTPLSQLTTPQVGLAFVREAHLWFFGFIETQLCGGVGLQSLYTSQDCKHLLRLLTKVQEWLKGRHQQRIVEVCGEEVMHELQVAIRDSVIHISQQMLSLPSDAMARG